MLGAKSGGGAAADDCEGTNLAAGADSHRQRRALYVGRHEQRMRAEERSFIHLQQSLGLKYGRAYTLAEREFLSLHPASFRMSCIQ
jgi:hypothetical protein